MRYGGGRGSEVRGEEGGGKVGVRYEGHCCAGYVQGMC